MAQVTENELLLRRLVGSQPFFQGLRLANQRHVVLTGRSGPWVAGQVRDDGQVHTTEAFLLRGPDHELLDYEEKCTCWEDECPHAVALVLAALRGEQAEPPRPTWERALAVLTGAPDVPDEPQIALLFDLALPDGSTPSKRVVDTPSLRLVPGVRGKKDNWVRQGISWSSIHRPGYGSRALPDVQRRLLLELFALAGNTSSYYYGEPYVHLEEVDSRRVWDLLLELQEAGVPLGQQGVKAGPVRLHGEPVAFSLDLSEVDGGLALRPTFAFESSPDDAPHPPLERGLVLGSPGHGVAWWAPEEKAVHLARLTAPLPEGSAELLRAGEVHVPESERDRFLVETYPKVRRRVAVRPTPELAIPEVHPPRLRCIVTRFPGHRVDVTWEWVYQVGDRKSLLPFQGGPAARDHVAEETLLSKVSSVLGSPVVERSTLFGMQVVPFLTTALTALEAMPEVDVIVDVSDDFDEEPAYEEYVEAPLITLAGESGERDWFDLAVRVEVDDEAVPFDTLFRALAAQDPYLLLPSGTYFRLDRPEFRQLAELIAEARAMNDVDEEGVVRLSRFQAGLWEELEQIGVVAGQAREWQGSVARLREVTELAEHEVPTGIKAELRPYQVAGFNWLATLHDLGLGGVLADDMGLGKTLQTLALFTHLRAGALSEPFLVVAPTSVSSNWAAEAARFAPDLRVVVICETQRRRGVSLAEAVRGADVVLSTYTLFRLEYEEYAEITWAGLVLDEAQLVKNHQGRGYQCARRLPVPFKLAITGTPMENNLMELWALLSITAPGLFPSPAKFTEYYRHPIEKEKDEEVLDRLRRRIRPLMLRRTKEQVATDLPPKQEQVLELELNPKHRKAYQTYLQRERQKVLGLLGDFEKNRFKVFRSITLLRQAALDVSLIDADTHAGVSSTKLDELVELVGEVAREGHRVLVFSQFTGYLRKAQQSLTGAGLEVCYLDGRTRDRAAVIESFKTGTAPAFLISLKAGGFGLNLTEADYCVVLDPWWNPASEAQAVDRAHRIGQTKNVMVYRMVAKGTIEEKVMALKTEKGALFAGVMDDGGFESSALTAEDVRGLLD